MTEPEAEDLALVEQLAGVLLRRRQYVVTAESCTGGGIAALLTAIPGSSNWFERGFVTYSNHSKREMLQVPGPVLDEHGAVSEPAVEAMARGALQYSHADYSIAVTGIAGPDGGTPDKPVGTVWFGWSKNGGATRTAGRQLPGDRQAVRRQTIRLAIQGLLDFIEADPDVGSGRSGAVPT